MKLLKYFLVFIGFVGLFSVRIFEETLFYDPFLGFFHEVEVHIFPNFDWLKLIGSLFFRFFLNLVFSVLIIHFLFNRLAWTKQAIILMCLVFIITLSLYLFSVGSRFDFGLLFGFYTRRFVIHPIALLIILPLYYYRLKKNG